MAAQLRDYYLSTLGIVQYVAKGFVAPDALVEQAAAADPAVQAADQLRVPPLPETTSPQPAASAGSGMARSIADQLSETQTPVTRPTAEPASDIDVPPLTHQQNSAAAVPPVTATEGRDSTQVKFRIASWQPVPDTLVFSALDYGQNPQQDQHQLLANILSAVQRLPSSLSEPELHDWPVIPNAPAGKSDAKAMFSEYLNIKIADGEMKWVLVFGERAKTYLLANRGDVAESQSITLAEGITALVMPGLDDMLTEPTRKRVAWNRLQSLLQAGSC